ncbi:uncharacterized protein LOC112270111 isoform X2 [Brachypodium distachyon]|uniref:uncharacterized protein LOC112270111 isoform X2 n=1 Tax=Brachypodium distachyon TaxID=15368 RepID=UPI000D0D2F07|nr:uncharacterized protein LOC112270111 isoform X2 [Brachypodium distachyon]|eukprot:XP_024313588.1 uncharacterized protein LOC112270111 isoform X2 [Brachypodium distachyon]
MQPTEGRLQNLIQCSKATEPGRLSDVGDSPSIQAAGWPEQGRAWALEARWLARPWARRTKVPAPEAPRSARRTKALSPGACRPPVRRLPRRGWSPARRSPLQNQRQIVDWSRRRHLPRLHIFIYIHRVPNRWWWGCRKFAVDDAVRVWRRHIGGHSPCRSESPCVDSRAASKAAAAEAAAAKTATPEVAAPKTVVTASRDPNVEHRRSNLEDV